MEKMTSAVQEMTGFTGSADFWREQTREWLETNGAGAFASSTTVDCHTRKYHGLLTAPLPGHEGRYVLLSSVEPSFVSGGMEFILASNQYPGTIYPQGYTFIRSFSILPFPTWEYRCGSIGIQKQVFMVQGDPSVYIAYTLTKGADTLAVDLKPLFAFRNSHHLSRANDGIKTGWTVSPGGISVKPYDPLPPVTLSFSGTWEAREDFHWEYSLEYPSERERGLESTEDRFFPGLVRVLLKKDEPFIIKASLNPPAEEPAGSLKELYRRQLTARTAECRGLTTPLDLLKHNSRHFLVTNSLGQKSVVAGYPWFGEWGRDTMIALPGLTMFNNNIPWGKDVLLDYAALIRDGLLPNTLGEMQGFTSYNSVDAGLLYFWSARKLLEAGFAAGDKGEEKNLKEKLVPALFEILNAFLEGRVPHCRLTPEGLLYAGSPDTQLTWMDAMAWGKPVTPRHGLAVDLNALWYNALKLCRELALRLDLSFPARGGEILEKFSQNYLRVFWMEGRNCLSDTVREKGQDGRLRPNQLFAPAMEGLLPRDKAALVVDTVKRELLTPWGLRTLAADDPAYAPWYEGDGNTRDSRYHQGTVWPWLLGILVESSLISCNDLPKELAFWENHLKSLLAAHLGNQGLGFISEVFDGAAGESRSVYTPPGKGCFAQAWSVGEIIRAFRLLEEGKKSLGEK